MSQRLGQKSGEVHTRLVVVPHPPISQAGCWNSGKVGKYLQYFVVAPPQAGCRNSGMQADVRANTGQWGMRLSRREKSGRYWDVKESALRKLSQDMLYGSTSTCLLVLVSKNIKSIQGSDSQTWCLSVCLSS